MAWPCVDDGQVLRTEKERVLLLRRFRVGRDAQVE
jgi:hypothetical protein